MPASSSMKDSSTVTRAGGCANIANTRTLSQALETRKVGICVINPDHVLMGYRDRKRYGMIKYLTFAASQREDLIISIACAKKLSCEWLFGVPTERSLTT